jgi:hypothetical protein
MLLLYEEVSITTAAKGAVMISHPSGNSVIARSAKLEFPKYFTFLFTKLHEESGAATTAITCLFYI